MHEFTQEKHLTPSFLAQGGSRLHRHFHVLTLFEHSDISQMQRLARHVQEACHERSRDLGIFMFSEMHTSYNDTFITAIVMLCLLLLSPRAALQCFPPSPLTKLGSSVACLLASDLQM